MIGRIINLRIIPPSNKLLITKAKYKVIEPYYIDDSTPDRSVLFLG
jgi:hypothetical protein